jgi:D-alanine-D-alanine ligase
VSNFNDCIILFGGSSEERLVSVASAQNLSIALPEATLWFWSKTDKIYEVSHEELSKHKNAFMDGFNPDSKAKFSSLESSLESMKDKLIIIGLHGTEGEDGKLQAIFEAHQIKYTGSDSKASHLAFDKRATKRLAQTNGLSVVTDFALNDFQETEINELQVFFKTHEKIVLKPLANGSSVGLFIVSSKDELSQAIATIKGKGIIPYMAEPFIAGREITVGVWQKNYHKTIALPCSEVRVLQGGQFDYQGKYLGKGIQELTPAPLTEDESKACQELALKLHFMIGCKGYSRTDMILSDKGPVILEINTLPGLTKASFIPQQLLAIKTDLRAFFSAQILLK